MIQTKATEKQARLKSSGSFLLNQDRPGCYVVCDAMHRQPSSELGIAKHTGPREHYGEGQIKSTIIQRLLSRS